MAGLVPAMTLMRALSATIGMRGSSPRMTRSGVEGLLRFQIQCEACTTNIVCFVVAGLVPATSFMQALSTEFGMRGSSPRMTRKQ
jgi:hypothetical protein